MTEPLFKTYVNGDQGDVLPRHEALRTVAVRDTEGEWLVMHEGDWVGADGAAWGARCIDYGDPLGHVDYKLLTGRLDFIEKTGFATDMIRPCTHLLFDGSENLSLMKYIEPVFKSRVEISLDLDGHKSGEAHGVPYPAQSNVVPVIEDQDLIIAHGVTPEIYDALADGTVTRWWDDMGSSVPAQELVLDVDEWDEDTGEAVLKWELKEN